MRKYKIAVIHPHLVEAGGSEARALYSAEALEGDYDVTLITMGHPDIGRLNRYYGTHLSADRTRVISFPIPAIARNGFTALRSYRVSRYCRANASRFDLMISTYNVMDFGIRGIQFIADLSFDGDVRNRNWNDPQQPTASSRKRHVIRRPYHWLSRVLARRTGDGWKRNLTIANSDWTAQVMLRSFGMETLRIYPPIVDALTDIPWEEREPGFVFLGRISPEKNIESIFEILKETREKGSNIHFHIVGDSDNTWYKEKIKALCEQNRTWASWEGKLAGEEKMAFIGRHRYGISACWNEAFGIAVAEMVKAGCLVWVPDGGGQTEIVGRPELIYSSREDAADKIGYTLKDGSLQSALRSYLEDRKEMFSVKRFSQEVRSVVAGFFESHQGRSLDHE